VGKLVGIAVLVAAVVGGIVLSSLAGASITSDDSKPSAKAVVTGSAPATSCARPRTTAAALVPLQGTPTPTATSTPTPLVSTSTPTATSTPTPLVPTSTPTATRTPTPLVPTNTPTATRTPTPPAPTATPTAVLVVSLSAGRAAKQSVLIRWRTASEPSLLGFNVYCGSSKHRVQRNTHLIRAHGSISGGRSYSFRDRIAARVRRAGPYWLQIVDVQGKRSWYGSVIAR
jgi:hypothetical protein